LQVITRAECYEYGWYIAPLEELLLPRYEELWADPDPAETIRRIARSQDERSYRAVRYYLKACLLVRRPQRRFNDQLEEIIETVITHLYFGEAMPAATSAAHAKQLAAQAAAKDRRLNTAVAEIAQELTGTTYSELPEFLAAVVTPKYSQGWEPEEFEQIVYQAANRHAALPEFRESMIKSLPPVNRSAAIVTHFAAYPSLAIVSDLLEEIASELPCEAPAPPIADVAAGAQPRIVFQTSKGVVVQLLSNLPDGSHRLRIRKGEDSYAFLFKADFLPEDTKPLTLFVGEAKHLPYLRDKIVAGLKALQ
jgi:hypothetical protein